MLATSRYRKLGTTPLNGKVVRLRTRYLIIGTFGSRDWVHTSFGCKIQKAVEYRSDGSGLAIVGEEYWAECVSTAI